MLCAPGLVRGRKVKRSSRHLWGNLMSGKLRIAHCSSLFYRRFSLPAPADLLEGIAVSSETV